MRILGNGRPLVTRPRCAVKGCAITADGVIRNATWTVADATYHLGDIPTCNEHRDLWKKGLEALARLVAIMQRQRRRIDELEAEVRDVPEG